MAIENITHLKKSLYVGGDPVYSGDQLAEHLEMLERIGAIILDVRSVEERWGGWDEFLPLSKRIQQPMWDDGKDNSYRDFMSINRKLEHAGYPEKPVFVHCHMGLNRSTSVALYLMMTGKGKLKPATAYERLVRLRPEAGINYYQEALDAALRTNQPGMRSIDRAALLAEWEQYVESQWDTERQRLNNRAVILRRKLFADNRPYYDGKRWRVAKMSR